MPMLILELFDIIISNFSDRMEHKRYNHTCALLGMRWVFRPFFYFQYKEGEYSLGKMTYKRKVKGKNYVSKQFLK